MFCPRCNNPLEPNAAFCGVCGALIKPQRDGETVVETPDSVSTHSQGKLADTVYARPPDRMSRSHSLTVTPRYKLPDKQFANQNTMRETPPLFTPSPDKKRKKNTKFFVFFVCLAIVAIAAGVTGGILWFQTRTASPPPITGQVSFFNSPDNGSGTTDALKITAPGLSNPPDGSQYDAWLIDTANEQILSLGSLSKSDPNTFTVSFAGTGSSPSSQVNLVGAGNRLEVTQEQGRATEPSGKIILTAGFPPQAFVHIRHLLVSFPATPANVALLTGLLNETQKVNVLSVMLQNSATSENTTSVTCIAQAIINVIEGKTGQHYHSLAADCARVGIGDAVIGDGFGILGNGKDGGYIPFTAQHAALAASRSDATDIIIKFAKDVETSTDSIKGVITTIDNDALQLLASPNIMTPVPQMVSLSDHAYRGFDQNGDGKIEPIVGEAGALTAYTSGQHMATLTLTSPS